MYYTMSEDKRIRTRIRFRDIQSDHYADLTSEQFEQASSTTVVFMEGGQDDRYPDYIETPLHLVSDRLKKLIELYDSTIRFKCVILNHIKFRSQKIYWLILTPALECLDQTTEFYPNGWEKRVVIDRDKAGKNRIFQIQGIMSRKLAVHVDLEESILRREFEGITFEQIEIGRG